MRNHRRLLLTTLCAALLGVLILQSAPAGKGGGKPGGGEPPPPPPVTYGLKFYSMPLDYEGGGIVVGEINDNGEIVGYYPVPGGIYQAFYFNAFSNDVVVTNLNDIELDPAYGVPEGWYIHGATGINNLGDICGALETESDPPARRGFVLEMRPDPTDLTLKPRMHLIPDEYWDHTWAKRINDAGEILGRGDDMMSYVYRPGLHGTQADKNVEILPFPFDAHYAHMNNPTETRNTQIVAWSLGEPVRYTLGDESPQPINIDGIVGLSGLSDTGSFCGLRDIQVRKTRYSTFGFLHDGVLKDFPEYIRDINASDDVVADRGSLGPVLYHKKYDAIDLNTAIVTASESDLQLWIDGDPETPRLTNRGIVGAGTALADFPALTGKLRRYDTQYTFFYEGYVLIPLTTP